MKPKDCCTVHYTYPLYIRLAVLAGGVFLWYILSKSDLTSLLGSTQVSTNLWVILLLGLVASVSTCLAVTGGVIVGYTDISSSSHPRVTQAWLQGGRLFGFIVFGGILGVLGEQISYSLGFTAWLNLIVSGLLLLLALQIIGILPKRKSKYALFEKAQVGIEKYSSRWRCSVGIGALTFFIPCGFTQMIQIMALASGSLWGGALMMGVFALGTLPGLVVLGAGTSYAKISHQKKFEGIVAVILIAFSLYSIQGSMSLLGLTDSLSRIGTYTASEVVGETEKIELVHNGLHLVPQDLVLTSGKNYEITITPESDGLGCMSTIALPSIDATIYPVTEGEQIIYILDNPAPGTYTFVCSSMGMSQGKIVVQ